MPVISLYHDYNHNNVYYDLGIMNYHELSQYCCLLSQSLMKYPTIDN